MLIIQSDDRNGKFYISLISILIAESLILGYPFFSKLTNVNTPLVLGGYTIFWFYGLATLILSYIATTNIAFNLLLAIHLIILLFLAFLSGFSFIGKLFISDIAETRADQKQPYIEMKEQFNQICDRLNLIEYPELQTVKVHLEKIKEDIRYSTSECLDETKAINVRLNNQLTEIQKSVNSIENFKIDNNSNVLLETIKILYDQLKQLEQIISERERQTKILRGGKYGV